MEPNVPAERREFRTWPERHHDRESELLIGYYKKDWGKPSITWPESVDEALRLGWIDGVRKGLDDERYTIRFTRRKPGSIWSSEKYQRAQVLIRLGLKHPTGRRAFHAPR